MDIIEFQCGRGRGSFFNSNNQSIKPILTASDEALRIKIERSWIYVMLKNFRKYLFFLSFGVACGFRYHWYSMHSIKIYKMMAQTKQNKNV